METENRIGFNAYLQKQLTQLAFAGENVVETWLFVVQNDMYFKNLGIVLIPVGYKSDILSTQVRQFVPYSIKNCFLDILGAILQCGHLGQNLIAINSQS